MGAMKDSRGVTLIELLVVVSIVAILVVALGFSYEGWMGKYRIESETKTLYTDLMDARARAMTRTRMYFVELNANNYSVYADTNDNAAFNPGAGDIPEPEYRVPGTFNVKPKTVEYTLGWTGNIGFDTRGLAWDYTLAPVAFDDAVPQEISITLPPNVTPDYDCILVGHLRIRTGQMSGGVCVAK
jgi:prepilin-type N-terminal cleavage/methylation domain-containing protein